MRRWLWLILAWAGAQTALADAQLRPVSYKHEDVNLEGCLAVDGAAGSKRPGVLLVCETGGNASAATRSRALQLARMGYAVFAADLYGKNIVPKDARDAAARLALTPRDRTTLRSRIQVAYRTMLSQSTVDARKCAAVGYGIGGSAVLELARTGVEELEGVIVVHGDLSTTNSNDAKKIGSEVIVFVGSDDPLIPPAQIAAFDDEMRTGGVDATVIRYGGALHDFTNPQARDPKQGSAYDADYDRRTHDSIRAYLAEWLAPAKPAGVKPPPKPDAALPAGVPTKVAKVLKHVLEFGEAMSGYEGGRNFLNIEQHLPKRDAKGRPIKYREWDVNPLKPGVNRGAERLVTGSDGSAYYTSDHYKSFKKIQ